MNGPKRGFKGLCSLFWLTWCVAAYAAAPLGSDYLIKPVAFNEVQVDDAFWTPRLMTNHTVTLPYTFGQCEQTGRIANFEVAAGLRPGEFEGTHFNDSDVYKIMEGAAYSLQVNPDPMMRMYLDQLIRIMAGAQWEDGYLFTFYSVPERQPEKRWTIIEWIHEQYCVGHMYEAAVAHYQVTGDSTFLNMAVKNADLICQVFHENGRTDPPGHQEIEIGLCKLYRATGDLKYLQQAKFFLDQRGKKGHRGPDGQGGLYGTYGQDHIPVVEQTEAVGHSVRAAYQYTGMADVAALTGDKAYIKAIDSIWKDVVDTKLYITGGIGAAGGHEGFGGPYELPNRTAYCETCASIANVLWNHRMFLMHGQARFMDVLERSLYNAVLSGISMQGDRFFYPNVLESQGNSRSPWFDCACCPSNIARFIPSVPGFAYACRDRDVYVNLFMSGQARIEMEDQVVTVSQDTAYPWDGKIAIHVTPEHESLFAVEIRIPGWARNEVVPSDLYRFQKEDTTPYSLRVNGQPVSVPLDKGYARIERSWKKGDRIDLELPMPVRRILSHPKVVTNQDKVALQRGPIVFCLEGHDNDGEVLDVYLPDQALMRADFRADLLNGVVTLTGRGKTAKRTVEGGVVPHGEKDIVAIPYYAWAHRGPSHMTVWPGCRPEGARPRPADTLTGQSQVTASYVHASLEAVKDQIIPANSSDTSGLQLDFWPHTDVTEWLQFEWEESQAVSSAQVYWFDDTGTGACRVPKAWRVLYRDAQGHFLPVKTSQTYSVEKDRFNRVTFETVQTVAIKLEIDLQKDWAAGVQEVIFE